MSTDQSDLFATGPYRDHAGYKWTDTSIEAARKVTPGMHAAHDAILAVLAIEPLTPDELAFKLGMDKLFCRPRCSELVAMFKVVDSGDRRPNASGLKARVLKLK
jgi:hypothetical protein